jgi:serine/threonine protein kinase
VPTVKLARYEVVRELGKGAMGIVYLAKDPLIGRLVALKTIRPARGDEEETREFQQRFVREAQAAGILNHPSIVTVHDIGQDEPSGVSFIAMEYVEGNNLKEILAQGRPLSFDEIGEIVAQVADAIDFAHSKGIVHRDVKPANIILVEGNRAKITDFGIAKIASGANLTTTGQFLGTPNYMAPEQIRGAPVDGRTDIFSLGICLYECLTRRKPFGGESLTSISYKIVHEPFPPLHEINPQIPDGYTDVVALCLAKDPTKRYQRGRDLAAALRAVVKGERPPRAHEPMLEENTVITRDHERIPTIELPFPEASGSLDQPGPMLHPGSRGTVAAVAAATPVAPGAVPISAKGPVMRPRGPAIVRKTLAGVRAYPLWKQRIPAPIFFAVVVVTMLTLLFTVVSIRRRQATIPKVNTFEEGKHARERQLRAEGNQLLRQGKLEDAYAKFEQLLRISPSSPAINTVMQKLSAIRQQNEVSKQQLLMAKQKFNEGLTFYNNKQYGEAINAFQESFHLNPSSDDAVNYLKLAQEMEQLTKEKKALPVTATVPPVSRGTTPGTRVRASTQTVTPAALAQLTTIFNSPVNDGYIMVKAGGEVVAHENLWEERGRAIFRRKFPRSISVTKEITPKNTDLEIWVVIPSMNIQEHRTIRQNFAPGIGHRLIVSFDVQTKKFDYQMN